VIGPTPAIATEAGLKAVSRFAVLFIILYLPRQSTQFDAGESVCIAFNYRCNRVDSANPGRKVGVTWTGRTCGEGEFRERPHGCLLDFLMMRSKGMKLVLTRSCCF
jgi:hypothetical protein